MCVLSNIGLIEEGYIKMIEEEEQKNIINRSICYKMRKNPRKIHNLYIYIYKCVNILFLKKSKKRQKNLLHFL